MWRCALAVVWAPSSLACGRVDFAAYDTDGDGVPDSVDNCPTVPNPDQGNEDGDRFGDVCDPCPTVADDDPPDSDGDGVADACDPHPTIPGDSIVLFEGFHHGVPPDWIQQGTWTADGDSIVGTPPVGTAQANLTITTPMSGHVTVSTEVTLVAETGTATDWRDIGAIADYAVPPDAGVLCAVEHDISNEPELSIWMTDSSEIATTSYAWDPTQPTLVTIQRVDAALTCTGSQPGLAQTTSGTYAMINPPEQVGLRCFWAIARFDWVMVVLDP